VSYALYTERFCFVRVASRSIQFSCLCPGRAGLDSASNHVGVGGDKEHA